MISKLMHNFVEINRYTLTVAFNGTDPSAQCKTEAILNNSDTTGSYVGGSPVGLWRVLGIFPHFETAQLIDDPNLCRR